MAKTTAKRKLADAQLEASVTRAQVAYNKKLAKDYPKSKAVKEYAKSDAAKHKSNQAKVKAAAKLIMQAASKKKTKKK